MSKKTLLFSSSSEIIEAFPVEGNPMLSKVKIKIASPGYNINGYYISKDVLERAAKDSLGLTPIVALYNEYTGDFQGHNEQAVHDRNGEYITFKDTKPVGVIPENPVIMWDEDDYLVTFGYLWTTRYEELVKVLGGKSQSMELSEEDTVMRPRHDGYIEILSTQFKGLCILGDDVPPAFEKASISGLNYSLMNSSKELEENLQKGVEDFMKNLTFALDNMDNVDLVVDTDGEERDYNNRKKITEAIDMLDEVAEDSENQDNIDKLDDAITILVDAETKMTKEPSLIPVSEDAKKALVGQPNSNEDVVSKESLSYNSNNSLLKKKVTKEEEEKLAVEKKKIVDPKEEEVVEETKVPVVEEETKETEAPVVTDEASTEVVTEVEEETPTNDGAEDIAPEGEVKEAEGTVPEPDKGEGVQPTSAETQELGGEVQTTGQDEAANKIGSERKTAENKRTSALLSDLDDADLYDYLIKRIGEAEEMRTKLTDILGSNDVLNDGLPGEGEVVIEGDISQEDLGSDVVATETDIPEKADETETVDGGVIEVDTEVASTEGEDGTDTEVEETASEEVVDTPDTDVEVEEKVEDTETEDEKKKKKPNFSIKEVVSKNLELEKEVLSLREENEKLLEFKLNIEFSEKENLLNSFNISDKGKEEIRLDFKKLSKEEIEDRAAILLYRESVVPGQKGSDKDIYFSLNSEAEVIEEAENSFFEALKKAKEINSKR